MNLEKLLITGAAGFLGSNLTLFAREKYEVIPTTLHPIEVEEYVMEILRLKPEV